MKIIETVGTFCDNVHVPSGAGDMHAVLDSRLAWSFKSPTCDFLIIAQST